MTPLCIVTLVPCKCLTGPLICISGYLVMSDDWFSEFVYEVVIDKKYIPDGVLKVLQQEVNVLPAWDPMGALAKLWSHPALGTIYITIYYHMNLFRFIDDLWMNVLLPCARGSYKEVTGWDDISEQFYSFFLITWKILNKYLKKLA